MMTSRPLLVSAAACALLAAGCSLILSTADPSQCATNRDCDANPSFKGRTCSEGFCVVPTDPVQQVNNDAGDGCTSTTVCTQQNSNEASICRVVGAPCTALQNDICPFITGPWDQPNAIIVGSILPFHVTQADGSLVTLDYADRLRRAIDLADAELMTALPRGFAFPGSPARPVAVLHCDSEYKPARAQLAMKHLTEVAGAQAVIVGGDTELLAVEEQAAATQTAVLCSDCVGPFPPGNSAWRIVPPLVQQAPMAAWRVSDLETKIMAGTAPPASLKVAVLTEPGRGEDAFVGALTSTLRFNGKSAADNAAAFLVETEEDPLTKAVIYKTHADAITTLAPDVIVVAMGADFPLHYLDLIETDWPAGKPRPYYVLTALLYDASPFATLLRNTPEVNARISGTRTAYDPALQNNITGFTQRYRDANNFKNPDGNFSGYDAFYAITYAMAAATSQPVYDGAHVTAGLERLRAGTVFDFGPDRLGTAIALLGALETVDVRGLWSGLDWDLTTHDLVVDAGMFCFALNGDNALVAKPDVSVRYAQATGVVTGTYTCE